MVVLASPKTPWYRLTDSRYRAAYARQVTNTVFTPTLETAERQMYTWWAFPITFDYADTITDIVMTLHQLTESTNYINRNFVVTLTENVWACTISIANPAVVTKVWHWLTTGQYIQLTTTAGFAIDIVQAHTFSVNVTTKKLLMVLYIQHIGIQIIQKKPK